MESHPLPTQKTVPAEKTKTPKAGKPGNSRLTKLAEQIAGKLEKEIISMGWPVGYPLGREADLVERFGANRWAVREALAITERDGLTEMRRGRNGGIFIAAPAESVVATTMRNYLLFSPIDIPQLIQIRRIIDSITYSQAVASAALAQLPAGRKMLEKVPTDAPGALTLSVEIYHQILAMANNRFLRIFGEMLSQLTLSLGLYLDKPGFKSNQLSIQMADIRHKQLECILAADVYGAVQAVGEASDIYLELFGESGVDRKRRRSRAQTNTHEIAELIANTFSNGRPCKRAEILTFQIQLDIMHLGLKAGDPIAPERELMARYGVGRDVLRDAIRALQRHGFVKAEQGYLGGLHVSKPTPDAVIRSLVLYFHFLQVPPREIYVIADEIMILSAEFVAKKLQGGNAIDNKLLEIIDNMIADVTETPRLDMRTFDLAIAEATGNPIIELLIGTMDSLLATNLLTQDEKAVSKSQSRHNQFHLTEILEALKTALSAGDVQMSRRHMAELQKARIKVELRRPISNSFLLNP